MKRVVTLVVACLVAAASDAAAQRGQVFTPSTNPVVDAAKRVFDSHSKNLIASADLMPADKYAFNPTPAQMTFGKLIAHIVQTNAVICSALTDAPPPIAPEALGKLNDISDKVTLAPMLKQSFEYCGQALAKLTDASLGVEATMFGKPAGMSRASALVTITIDWADHYSTAAGYLRLNSVLPPSAQPAK